MAKALRGDKLTAILQKAISDSEHITDGHLAKEREEVDSYYKGNLPKPMHRGDSKYVSRDVFDAVDSARATIVESFSASSRIVFFRPEKGETADDAKQATDYCRHVFFKKNDGDGIIYDAATEGLTKRFVFAKVYREEIREEEEYDFDGMTPEELTVEVSKYPNYEFRDAETSENGLFSGGFTVENVQKRVVVELIQPEDLLIASKSASIRDAKYIIHRVSKSKSDLLKEGYDEDKVEEIVFGETDMLMEYDKQRRFEEVDDVTTTDTSPDEAGKEVTVYEIYIHLDKDGRGTTKLWKFCFAQGIVLDEEEIARMPFAAFVPLPRAHTFFGENFAAAVIPVQNARTVLFRQIINHSLITNNPRLQVLNGTVLNPQELIDNRLGGIVNVRRMDGVAPLPQANLNPYVFNLIAMLDEDKEEVTGISKLSQGLNKDAISSQNSQGMVEQLISMSQQRQKIIARRFGEFLKDIWLLIYQTASDFIEEDEFLDVTGNYIPVNPMDWANRSAASVELSLGYGEAEQEALKWAELHSFITQDPILAGGYDYQKAYGVMTRGLEKRGIEDINSILTPPEEMKPKEPSEAEKLQLEQMKSQIEYQRAQAQAMVMKAETDKMTAQAALIKAQAEASYKSNKSVIEAKEIAHDIWIDGEELELAKQVQASNEEQARVTLNPGAS